MAGRLPLIDLSEIWPAAQAGGLLPTSEATDDFERWPLDSFAVRE